MATNQRRQARKAKKREKDLLRSCKRITISAGIRSEDLDEEARTAEVSFSSENPVKDYSWMPPVVLLHEKRAVNFSRFQDSGAVLVNHDVDQIVGRPERVTLDTEERKGRALIRFDKDDESQRIFEKVLSGSLRGVSVRYSPENLRELDEGEAWTSPEGRSFRGPVIVVDKWEPREFSLTPIPADQEVGVGRDDTEDSMMPDWAKTLMVNRGLIDEDATDEQVREAFEEFLAAGGGEPPDPEEAPERGETDPPAEDPQDEPVEDQPRAAEGDEDTDRAERARVKELFHIGRTAQMEDQVERWVEENFTPDQARKEALRTMAQSVPRGSTVHVERDESDKAREAVQGVLAQRAVRNLNLPDEVAKRHFQEKYPAAADLPPDVSLLELARFCAMRTGAREARTWTRDKLVSYTIGRAYPLTTSDFPALLANVATKSLAAGFNEAQVTYPAWTQTLRVPDFKAAKRVKLSEAGDLKLVPESMPLEESSLSDVGENYQVATYGRKFGISRQAIINDDLEGISRVPSLHGAAARRTLNGLVYSTFLANPTMAEDSTALFATTHTSGSNLTSSGGAFSIDTLSAGMKLMALQKGFGPDTAGLNISPSFVLCPVGASTTVRQIVEGQVNAAQASNAILPWMRNLTVISEPLLDANDANAWYLAARPVVSGVDTVAVVFLEGSETPTLERVEGGDILGVEMKIYWDFGCKVLEHRGLYKNDGGA